jgi:hypothetical protein
LKYTFRKIQCHEKIPDLTGWYWYINTDEALLDYISRTKGISANSIHEVSKRLHPDDPFQGHYSDAVSLALDLKIRTTYGEGQKINLMTLTEEVNDILVKPKIDMYMSHPGIYLGANLIGFTPDCGQRVVHEIVKNEYDFPETDEIITISRWGDGKHFYLSSSTGRDFKKKYNTYKQAEERALKFVDKDNIREDNKFTYTKIGD